MARKPEVDLDRLCEAIRTSRMVLEPYRVARREAARKYAGDQWSSETAYVPRPVNFLSLYMQIMSRNLISHDPQAMLSTFKKEYKAIVSAMEDWVNPELVRMDLAATLERGGMDALYGFHVMKVGLATPAMSEKSGWEMGVGMPYAQCVDLDDWCMDPHARTFKECSWMGHRSRVMVETLRGSKLYEAVKRKRLQPTQDQQNNEDGDERISMLGRQYVAGELGNEAYDYVDLWEIYLPMEKLVVTMMSEDGGSPMLIGDKREAFDIRPYIGPYCGPYHFLSLMPPVAGNAMSKGPVQDLILMDEHLNGIMTKLIQQAARQKEILAVAGNDGDAKRVVDARDGEVLPIENPDKMKPMGFGGPHPNNQNFALSMWEMLNKIGGNIELMGGLGEQSKTATQDKLLNANSSATMKWMQQAMVKHTSKVIESILWFYHHHPEKVMTGYREIEGLEYPIERKVTPRDREKVPFEEIEIRVDPYSLSHSTPGERLAFINQVVQQTIIPLMPILQQQGIGFDAGKFLELISKYSNNPDIEEIITNLADNQGEPQGEEEPGSMKPSSTRREYNRVNSSTQTGEGQVKANLQQMMGQNRGGRPSNNVSYQPVSG